MYLFCYGSLKKGRHNHGYLADSTFVGNFITSDAFSLIVSDLPFLVRRRSRLGGIRGEVYKVSPDDIRRLDALEGHPDYYQRELITVYNEENNEALEVYAYIYPDVFNKHFNHKYRICREY